MLDLALAPPASSKVGLTEFHPTGLRMMAGCRNPV